MRISRHELQNVLSAYVKRVSEKPDKQAADTEKTGSAKTDSIALSEKARELSKLRSKLDDISAVRPERVDELKEKIEAGEYKVSEEEVAEKILERFLADSLAEMAEKE
jgi:negative regulator of flagellin synthesis FlgM